MTEPQDDTVRTDNTVRATDGEPGPDESQPTSLEEPETEGEEPLDTSAPDESSSETSKPLNLLCAPKDFEHPEWYEDAGAFRTDHRVLTVADGVSEGMFCRLWADILTQRLLFDPPDPAQDDEHFGTWLADAREEWRSRIDFDGLSYFQKKKLNQVGGGYATLLWVQFDSAATGEADADGITEQIRCRIHCVGDCNLFVLREGSLVRTFPVDDSSQFGSFPDSLGSTASERDAQIIIRSETITLESTDHLLLGSDEIAEWIMKQFETDQPVDPEFFLRMEHREFGEFIADRRGRQEMKADDCTLLCVSVAALKTTEEPETADIPMGWATEISGDLLPVSEPTESDVVEEEPAAEESTASEPEGDVAASVENGNEEVILAEGVVLADIDESDVIELEEAAESEEITTDGAASSEEPVIFAEWVDDAEMSVPSVDEEGSVSTESDEPQPELMNAGEAMTADDPDIGTDETGLPDTDER